jgi:hypothetical protein
VVEPKRVRMAGPGALREFPNQGLGVGGSSVLSRAHSKRRTRPMTRPRICARAPSVSLSPVGARTFRPSRLQRAVACGVQATMPV